MVKYLFLLSTLMLSNIGWAQGSFFKCDIFDRSGEGSEIHSTVLVDAGDFERTLFLADGIHRLRIRWWQWALNLSVFQAGDTSEIIGSASSSDVTLRLHSDVDLSVSCKKLN